MTSVCRIGRAVLFYNPSPPASFLPPVAPLRTAPFPLARVASCCFLLLLVAPCRSGSAGFADDERVVNERLVYCCQHLRRGGPTCTNTAGPSCSRCSAVCSALAPWHHLIAHFSREDSRHHGFRADLIDFGRGSWLLAVVVSAL